jgi:hypothetical protein
MSAPASEPWAVYAGRQLLGFVRMRSDGRYEAKTSTGTKLGLFNAASGARETIVAEARKLAGPPE